MLIKYINAIFYKYRAEEQCNSWEDAVLSKEDSVSYKLDKRIYVKFPKQLSISHKKCVHIEDFLELFLTCWRI